MDGGEAHFAAVPKRRHGLLEIRNVTHRFGNLVALRDVSLGIEAGEFFTLLGPPAAAGRLPSRMWTEIKVC